MRKQNLFKTILTVLSGGLCAVCLFMAMSFSSLFTAKAEIKETSSKVMECVGASIRVADDGYSGIRFHVRIKLNKLNEKPTVTLDDGISYTLSNGQLVNSTTGKILTTGIEITPEDLGSISVNTTSAWSLKNEGDSWFVETQAYVYNLEGNEPEGYNGKKPENYVDRQFAFCGWYKSNGTTYTTATQTRTPSYVAMMAKYEIDNVDEQEWTGLDNNLYKAIQDEKNKASEERVLIPILDSYMPQTIQTSNFVNTDKYLYRVGNQNEIALSSLFNFSELPTNCIGVNGVIETTTIGDVTVTNTKETIKFEGTGPVTLSVKDYSGKTTASLNLEVINAKNITKAESATANNVVLLNDISGTFVVSNGHTFYGNGFTVKLPTTSVQNVGNGFTGYISIGATQDDGVANGGNLDNVRIEGPVYPEMYIYRDQAKITDSLDADYDDGYNMRYFKNSVIVYGGNCTISNSYISGSRTALCLRGGNNVVIENTTLSGGAYANMQICAGSSVTLRNLTTEQVDVADSYGKGKTAHGLGIAVDSNVVDIYIEGELKQYNWLCKQQWESIVPRASQGSFPDFFGNNTFSKYWHYLNGGTEPYVNMAFIFGCDWDTSKIHDDRKSVDYETCNATINKVNGGVYSKLNTVGGNSIADIDLSGVKYVPTGFNPIAPTLKFDIDIDKDPDDPDDANDTYCVYNESIGVLKIGVTGDSKTINLSNVSVEKNSTSLDFTAYLNGVQISDLTNVTIASANGTKQTLTFKATSNDAGYDKDGNPIKGSVEYTWKVTVEVATLSYPAPVWNMGGSYQFDKTNCYFVYYTTNQGYGEAVPIYEGIKINYYDKNGKLVNLDLSGTKTLPTGSNNSNANAFTYTLSDGSTLTMKYSSGWKSGATTHQFTTYSNKVYVYPQSLDNDNYVRAKVTNQDFDVKISYTFTDPNGQSITQTMRWYNAKDSNSKVSTVQWKDFDSTNGKKSSGCVTPDTLVTLADGTQKEIQYVTYTDKLLVWDFTKGKYTTVTASIVMNHGYDYYTIVTLNFADGTVVKTINGHGFYDLATNEFVILGEDNAENYIGQEFATQNGTTKLVSYSVATEYTESWSILTIEHYNCILEGMITLTPAEVEGSPKYLMPFEIGEGMKYDEEQMQADIEKYGLYTYEDFAEYMTYEQFEVFNFAIFKVSVGKGYITWEEILYLISIHIG